MRLIKRVNEGKRAIGNKREYSDAEKIEIKERIAKIVARRNAKKEQKDIDIKELLKKDNVVEISKEVKIQLEDRDLYLEPGDVVEIIPASKKWGTSAKE